MGAVLAEPVLLFYLVAGIILLTTLGVIVHVWPKVGVAMFVALIAITTDLRDPVLPPAASIAGIVVGPLDVLAGVMLVSAIVHVGTDHVRGRHLAWILLLVGLLGFNVLRGIEEFGLQTAVNEARSWIYLFAALAYCVAAPIRDFRWWTRLVFFYCAWLVIRIIAGLAVTGLQPVTSYIEVNGRLVDPRPVTAAAAAVLAQVMLLVAARNSRRREQAILCLLVAALVAIQHRTVWFAAAGGMAYFAFVRFRHGGRGRLAVVLGSGGLAVVTMVAFLTGVVQRSAVAVSASNITASDNTFTWRLTGWRELLQEHITLTAVLIGKPFGSGFSRLIGGQVVDVSAHSHYVETFLRFGLIGLLATVLVFASAWRAASKAGSLAPALRAALIIIVLFGITYRCDPVQGILLGTVIGLAAPRVSPVRPWSTPAQHVATASA